jgi:hypothetical protein
LLQVKQPSCFLQLKRKDSQHNCIPQHKCLCFHFLGQVSHAGDADDFLAQGSQLLRKSIDGDNASLVPAVKLLTKAAALHQLAGNEEGARKANALLYWSKKRMTLADIESFQQGADAVSVTTLERASKEVPSDQAGEYYRRAVEYARANPDDQLLIAIRFFEVADRFAGTRISLQAQRASLDAMQKLRSASSSPASPRTGRETESAARSRQANALSGIIALIDTGELDAADARLRAARAEGIESQLVSAARELALAFKRRMAVIREAMRAEIGQTVSLETTKGSRRGVLRGVTGEGVTLEAQYIINRQVRGRSASRLRWSELTAAALARFAGRWKPPGPIGAIARALVAATAGDRPGAERILAEAGAHPLVGHARDRIAVLNMGESEAAAKRPDVARRPRVPADAASFGGHWYKLYMEPMSWHEAKRFCEEQSGHLVTITSRQENDFVTRLARSARDAGWIGLTDEREEGKWEWVTGEQVVFTAWARGEPNNKGRSQDHVCVLGEADWSWDDNWTVRQYAFICEWESAATRGEAEVVADQFSDPPNGTPTETETVGGGGGHVFRELPDPRAILVGFRARTFHFAGNLVVKALRPVWLTGRGRREGETRGKASGRWTEIVARPGYAVGMLKGRGGDRLNGFRLVFMRIRGKTLDTADSYESEWFGGPGGGDEKQLGGEGRFIIGVHGRCGLDLDSIGLLIAP